MGRIAWAAIRSRTCWCSASAPASTPRSSPRNTGRGRSTRPKWTRPPSAALEPFERGAAGENPFAVQHELQDMMQKLVGIVRVEGEMQQALEEITKLRARAAQRRHRGQPRIQHRLAHGARSGQSAGDFRDRSRIAGIERKESRGGALPRRLSGEERGVGQVQPADHQRRRTASPRSSACRWCR